MRRTHTTFTNGKMIAFAVEMMIEIHGMCPSCMKASRLPAGGGNCGDTLRQLQLTLAYQYFMRITNYHGNLNPVPISHGNGKFYTEEEWRQFWEMRHDGGRRGD